MIAISWEEGWFELEDHVGRGREGGREEGGREGERVGLVTNMWGRCWGEGSANLTRQYWELVLQQVVDNSAIFDYTIRPVLDINILPRWYVAFLCKLLILPHI